jgi:hypothetical protein
MNAGILTQVMSSTTNATPRAATSSNDVTSTAGKVW